MDANWWDVVSDLSVFHRVDNPVELPPQRLIDMAVRLVAYPGVVAARGRNETDAGQLVMTDRDGNRVVDSSTAGLTADPVLSQFLDIDTVDLDGLGSAGG